MPDEAIASSTVTPAVAAPPSSDSAPSTSATPPSTESTSAGPSISTVSAEEMATAMAGFEEMGLSPTAGLAQDKKAKAPKPADDGDDSSKPPGPQEPRGPGRPSTRAKKLEAIADPVDRERLSRMSNEAFDKFYDLTLKLQNKELFTKDQFEAELKTRHGETTSARYFDHEQGYTLTPEYQTLTQHSSQLTSERDFWAEQLSNVREGKPVSWLERNAKGEVTVSTQQIDPKAAGIEGALIGKITQATTLLGNVQNQIGELPKQHTAQYQKFNGDVTKMDQDLFGQIKGDAFTKAVGSRLEQFPAILRARPEIQLLAKALVAGDALLNRVTALEKDLAKSSNAVKAISNGAPSPLTTGSSAPAAQDPTAMRDQLKQLNAIASGRAETRW